MNNQSKINNYVSSSALMLACIISSSICTVVMIWGVYAMRADMLLQMDMPQQNSPQEAMGDMPMSIGDMDMSDPMSMSMRDMKNMLEGKTGDDLDRAFLEGMIPHHQGALDMAKYLEKSTRPELQKLGKDIIASQKIEIEQMQKWLKEWNLSTTKETQTSTNSMMKMENMTMPAKEDGEEAMREHCKMMPQMAGCEVYK